MAVFKKRRALLVVSCQTPVVRSNPLGLGWHRHLGIWASGVWRFVGTSLHENQYTATLEVELSFVVRVNVLPIIDVVILSDYFT
jgi:hypothetical protein